MRRFTLLAVPLLLAACEPAADTATPFEPAFAKGKPPTITNVPSTATVHDVWQNTLVETDVRSDGGGVYVDGACGVTAWIRVSSDGANGARLFPDTADSNCRRATLRLVSRHDGLNADGSHKDVVAPLGEFDINQLVIQTATATGLINAPTRSDGQPGTSCFEISKSGRITGQGLRFNPAGFPGSNSLVVETIEPDRHYRAYTLPYPDNVAYCNNNEGISFWHVVMDVEFQAS